MHSLKCTLCLNGNSSKRHVAALKDVSIKKKLCQLIHFLLSINSISMHIPCRGKIKEKEQQASGSETMCSPTIKQKSGN